MKNNLEWEVLSYSEPTERIKWLELCNSFKGIDVYFYPQYLKLFELNGDGEPFLFVYYQSPDEIVIYPFLKRSLSQISWLKNIDGNLFDITSPYGFCGYLSNSNNINKETFFNFLSEYCYQNNIITEFIRFHPILENINFATKYINIRQYNETIYIDLSDEIDNIWRNMSSRCRNAIRKAKKNSVKIIYDYNLDYIDIFHELYSKTMERLKAENYYFFSRKWIFNLSNLLKGNFLLVHAEYKGKIISSAIFIYNTYIINYYLAGSLCEMRNLQANNLILSETSLWAKQQGIKYFHLGGGYHPNDNLFYFKKSFSPLRKKYFLGNVIHNKNCYDYICKNINLKEEKLNMDYFPLYRYPC